MKFKFLGITTIRVLQRGLAARTSCVYDYLKKRYIYHDGWVTGWCLDKRQDPHAHDFPVCCKSMKNQDEIEISIKTYIFVD
jgi:hypothetical protein